MNIEPKNPKKTGKHWKGGKIIDNKGYRRIYYPGHHRASKGGYVAEHILVAEMKLGRRLSKQEEVHHIDFDKLNNHPDNLMILSKSEHQKIHHPLTGEKIKCPYCGLDFYRNRYKVENRENHFCSKQCYAESIRKFRISDEELISLLKQYSVTGLSKKLGVPRTTIQDRKNKLKKQGLIV